jgi:hypothetical protein
LKAWDTFAEICGCAAATLAGPLFVAVSIRIASIARSQELRNRAAQTLSLFGIVLIISVLIAIPGEAYRTLGAELVFLAVIAGTGLYILDRRAKGERSNQAIAPILEAVTPTTVTSRFLTFVCVPGRDRWTRSQPLGRPWLWPNASRPTVFLSSCARGVNVRICRDEGRPDHDRLLGHVRRLADP